MTVQVVALLIFIGLQAADIWTTQKALKMGKREMNPLLAKLFEYADPVGVMVAVKLAGVWALWWVDNHLITLAACMVYVIVINNNLDAIEKK